MSTRIARRNATNTGADERLARLWRAADASYRRLVQLEKDEESVLEDPTALVRIRPRGEQESTASAPRSEGQVREGRSALAQNDEERALVRVRRYRAGSTRITDLPGIQVAEARALRARGYSSSDALLSVDAATIREATHIALPRVAKLRSLAELMTIPSVNPALAAALYTVGYRGRAEVAASNVPLLADVVLRARHAPTREDRDAYKLEATAHAARILRDAQPLVSA